MVDVPKAIASTVFDAVYPDIFVAFDKYDIYITVSRQGRELPHRYEISLFIDIQPSTPQIGLWVEKNGKLCIYSCWDDTNFINMIEKEIAIEDPDFIDKTKEALHELLFNILNKRNKRVAELIKNELSQ